MSEERQVSCETALVYDTLYVLLQYTTETKSTETTDQEKKENRATGHF